MKFIEFFAGFHIVCDRYTQDISLVLTPFDHFRLALAVKCIPDLRVCLTDIPPIDDLSIPGGAWLDVCFCLYETDI